MIEDRFISRANSERLVYLFASSPSYSLWFPELCNSPVGTLIRDVKSTLCGLLLHGRDLGDMESEGKHKAHAFCRPEEWSLTQDFCVNSSLKKLKGWQTCSLKGRQRVVSTLWSSLSNVLHVGSLGKYFQKFAKLGLSICTFSWDSQENTTLYKKLLGQPGHPYCYCIG